ncbi:MAG: alpha/beta fold hydrolase [Actinomycetota bacterium]|nr:alpha/beta hydrolase [Actinomycetota bacterium]
MHTATEAWYRAGRLIDAGGRKIFVIERGSGPVVFILHGFPGSSFDWIRVADALESKARIVTFDLLGHGFSDKPDARYSLFDQADIAVEVARQAGIDRCTLVGHDVGDTVAAELLMRSNEGRLPFTVDRAMLTNGSIFMDLVQLSAGQIALLSLPDEVLTQSLPLEGFRSGLASTFSPAHMPDADTIDAMLSLIAHNEGDRVLPRVIRYIDERRANQDRWTAGLVEYSGPMTAAWGEQDPIAVPSMPRRLSELRPATEVVTWDDVGHWPSVEVPGRVAALIADRIT